MANPNFNPDAREQIVMDNGYMLAIAAMIPLHDGMEVRNASGVLAEIHKRAEEYLTPKEIVVDEHPEYGAAEKEKTYPHGTEYRVQALQSIGIVNAIRDNIKAPLGAETE